MIETSTTASVRGRARAVRQKRKAPILLGRAPGALVAMVISVAFVATALGALGYSAIQHSLLVVLTFATAIRALMLARSRPLSWIALLIITSVPFLFALSVIASETLTGNHLYFIFLPALLLAMRLERPVSRSVLLRITNAYYIVYLGLSLLVYLGVVTLGRELNVFDATQRIPWLEIRTLVGFYGSTSHIDSISLFVAIVNLMFGRGTGGHVVAVLAIVASLASVRLTPFVALSIATFGAGLVWSFKWSGAPRRWIAVAIALTLVLSAPLSMVAADLFPSGQLEDAINRATTGRLRIWLAMGEAFKKAPLVTRAFGIGTTDPYYLVGGWPQVHPVTKQVSELWTANPHNSYLSVALNLGIVVFVILTLSIAYLISRISELKALIVVLYVLSVGITNAELFTFFHPIYMIWIMWLSRLPCRREKPINLASVKAQSIRHEAR